MALDCNDPQDPPGAQSAILRACNRRTFRTRGQWGMRENCLLGGFGTTERTPCAVIDLGRTNPHPTRYGHTVPIVLASGDTWEAVLAELRAKGEVV